MLIKAGLFDPRGIFVNPNTKVAYWEPAKWIAKLRDMGMDKGNRDEEPSLFVLDCKLGSGHFGSSGRYAYLKEIAADYSFVIRAIENVNDE
jgi:oligopeptidase B